MKMIRAVALVTGFAIAIFGAASLAAPGEAAAGYWTTRCNHWGCQRVYVPTCHRRVVGYNRWGHPIFREVCH